MALLVKQNLVETGWTEALVSATAGGDYIMLDTTKDHGWLFMITNADAAPHTVTIPGVRRNSLGTLVDATMVVTNATTVIGRIPARCKDQDSGRVDFTYDAVTSVTVAVLEA